MADKVLHVNVISPESILYQGDATYLRIPGSDGSFGVLYNHAQMVAEVQYGVLFVKNKEMVTKIFIDGGFVQINKNIINVLARNGELVQKMNTQEIEKKLSDLNSKRDSESLLEAKKLKAKLASIKA